MNFYCGKCRKIFACKMPGFSKVLCKDCTTICSQRGNPWDIVVFTFQEDDHTDICSKCKKDIEARVDKALGDFFKL